MLVVELNQLGAGCCGSKKGTALLLEGGLCLCCLLLADNSILFPALFFRLLLLLLLLLFLVDAAGGSWSGTCSSVADLPTLRLSCTLAGGHFALLQVGLSILRSVTLLLLLLLDSCASS